MTLEQILADIRSDRIKKVIIDSDTCNEIDDQYAIAYAIGSNRMNVVAINAAPYFYHKGNGYPDGAERSYNEILRVLKACHREDAYPVFRGSTAVITEQEGFAPIDSPAARNIIKVAHESDEIVYILALGAITNVMSAILTDPSIKDNICVVWLGGNCLEREEALDEYNLEQDYAAGQLLLNCGVNLIMLPAEGPKGLGTQVLSVYREELEEKIPGDSDCSVFFREILPDRVDAPTRECNGGMWIRILWDIAAPAVLAVPEAFEYKIIPAPVFTDDRHYAYDKTRGNIIYMVRLDPTPVFDDMYRCINKF